jgi:hypothetical protein
MAVVRCAIVGLLFLLKPVFYVVAFTLAHVRFKAHGPHTKLAGWLAVLLATLMRIALGVAGFFALMALSNSGAAYWVGIFVLGFLWWLLVAKVFFRRAPNTRLIAFAVVAELMSATIDYLTIVDLQDFRLC